MSAGEIVSERERVTCTYCRRRRPPDTMTGTRCSDRVSCLQALGRWVSAKRLTGAEREALARVRENRSRARLARF